MLRCAIILSALLFGSTGVAVATPVVGDGVCTDQSCRPPKTGAERPSPYKPVPKNR